MLLDPRRNPALTAFCENFVRKIQIWFLPAP